MRRPLLITDGLVGYWPICVGSTVTGASALYGNAGPLDLTNTNAVAAGAGPSNNLKAAGDFEAGSSQYFTRADATDLSIAGGDATIVAWVNMESKPANSMGIASKFTATGNQREWGLRWENTLDRFQFLLSLDGTSTGATGPNTATAPDLATWYMVTAQFSNASARASIQQNLGAPVFVTIAHNFKGTAVFEVGSFGVAVNFWDGLIAHVGLWHRILSQQELFWLYNNGQGRDLTRGA